MVESESIVASAQPDPTISIGLSNMPLDSFDFNQERMTQAKIGISQKFGRGDSLALTRKQLMQKSEQFPFMRLNRQAQLKTKITELWLRAYQAGKTITLVNRDRSLFEQLVNVAESRYSSTLGKTRQQDVIRAQLELIRLDDRLIKLNQQKANYLRLMGEYLPESMLNLPLANELPKIVLPSVDFNPMTLGHLFSQHPQVVSVERKISSMKTGIDVAKQGYKPQWGVNASYGYRADNQAGVSQSDLFSVGVTFDLPLFTNNKQNPQVRAAVSRTESIKTEKRLLLNKMIAESQALNAQLMQLTKRQQLFVSQIVPQTHQQAEASLNAYANDNGDFSEVMRARINELNTSIEVLNISIEKKILTTQLAYFFTNSQP